MMRRPPGLVAPQRKKYLLAAIALFIAPTWFQLADAQQQHQPRSPSEADDHHAVPKAVTALTGRHVVEAPHIYERRKTTIVDAADTGIPPKHQQQKHQSRFDDSIIPSDASAKASALDLGSVRAAPPSAYKVGNSVADLLQPARTLEDFEVEDFVLLATVDGDLYASDRKTGQERWHLKADHPMVETRHFRVNRSDVEEDFDPIDHYIWVVEPSDGELYLIKPHEAGSGLAKMGWTMKKMVEELSPHNDPPNGIVYNGEKKTTIITLNAATGAVIKEFSASGTYVNKVESERCYRQNALADGDNAECSNSGTITLGRTDYTVAIQRTDGTLVASLKYSEWGPNTRDNDLIRQNIIAKDNRYITGQHDGRIYGFNYARSEEDRPYFSETLSSPVARVFDVFHHRWAPESGRDSDLVVLPQPLPPSSEDDNQRLRNEVFIGQTEGGSWYALSGNRYPLIQLAPEALVRDPKWWERRNTIDIMDEAQLSKALIGTHQLPDGHGLGSVGPPPKLPLGLPSAPYTDEPAPIDEKNLTPVDDSPLLGPGRLLQNAKESVAEMAGNYVSIILVLMLIWTNVKPKVPKILEFLDKVLRHYGHKGFIKEAVPEKDELKPTPITDHVAADSSEADTDLVANGNAVKQDAEPAAQTDALINAPTNESNPVAEPEKVPSPTVTFAEPVEVQERLPTEGPETASPDTPKAKKAHRGTRGGKKHKKKNKQRDADQSREDDPPEETVEEVVNKAKQLGQQPTLEPDILTVPNGVDDVSGPILKMGSLEVNEEQQLGTGSNGTVVFAGKWDGRAVAVKRMLVQFNEIASQETKLLRESDDHPNVIRYFAQQQRAAFLYIALELCQASLADVVQKPHMFRELAQAGERDMPHVLYQITNGLSHLHSLRIVHRDLKPQNILVNMGKDGRPRVLVSDFGLCKKLEGGQSSFGATTAHAAGTSGWRAPELLLDDDAPGSNIMTLTDPNSSMHSASGTGSGVVGTGQNARRVTRAIDIFSLGLVFYYVLTRGSHPFDCGDRYMREVNIRKGERDLRGLDVLGDVAPEAYDLIGSMLAQKPKERPTARDVMAHPFFWSAKKRLMFLCDVSDHFEKEPRDPPSEALQELESWASHVIKDGDFLRQLPKEFVDSLGKQRKYTGGRMLDLLRALRNKRNHYEDMPDSLKKTVGPLPDGYLSFWTTRFPNLLITCWNVVFDVHWEDTDRFREYYEPAGTS